MLQRILRIDDFRIFQDWRGDSTSPDLARVNVIYGINGSGKSSLSSILAHAAEDVAWSSGLRVRAVDDAGQISTVDTAGDPFWNQVYVFDKNYVAANLRFDINGDSTTEPLLVLGKERIDQKARIDEIEKRRTQIAGELDRLAKDQRRNENRAASLATDTATTITQELATVGGRYEARSYNARQVKALLANAASGSASADVTADLAVVNSADQSTLALPDRGEFDTSTLESDVEGLLARDVTAKVLESLRDDPQRAQWVQEGLALHKAGDQCAFCDNKVTSEQIARLEQHFDRRLIELQQACVVVGQRIRADRDAVVNAFQAMPSETALDTSLRADWSGELAHVKAERTSFELRLDALDDLVNAKKSNPFESHEVPAELAGAPRLDLIALADVIRRHNDLAGDASRHREAAAARIEHARVDAVRVEYANAVQKATECGTRHAELLAESHALEQEVRDLAQEELDATPLADGLNDELKRLLGHAELSFELADNGYSIRRGGEPALYLSEGEKTAISLLYFLKSLDAHDCDRPNSIVVIDDPVSSLDSNVVAGVSAHLWSRLVGGEKCRQLILLTHSFDLFRSWTNQLDRLHDQVRNTQGITTTMQELRTRVKSTADGGTIREPYFMAWPDDKALRNRLRSEYHYLFWRVADTLQKCQHESSPEAELDAAAVLPNVCRRLLEGFLSFKYPGKIGDFRELMEAAIGSVDESVTRTRLVTYLHRYSHNEEGDISKPVARPESVRILGAVFDLIHKVDADHYDKMCAALQVQPELLDA